MRRVVSLWLPTWPTDRLRRHSQSQGWGAPPVETPLVTAGNDGHRAVVMAADAAAAVLGLHPGMPLTQARALVPGLVVHDADPASDAQALARLAGWCLRYAPLTAPDPPDGIWIDCTGAAHLHGGEAALLADMVARLGRVGMAARAALADTPGAAYALARHLPGTVLPPGETGALLDLPVAALRLPPETVAALRRLGLDRIGAVEALPRGPLARRFGRALAQRLDQAFGRAPEPIRPVVPEAAITHRLCFIEPLLTAEAFAHAIDELLAELCPALEAAGQGARRLDVLFERLDGSVQALGIGTAAPSRNAAHLGRLLKERIADIDPGLGVEAMQLVVPLAEIFVRSQAATLIGGDAGEADLAALIDRIANRLGAAAVWRAAPVESDVPERAVARVSPVAEIAAVWPAGLPRPLRLLDPPQPIDVLALLPDHPPAAFVWRRRRHRVRRADGPERIFGEWWRRDAETEAVRDYFAVEDEDGARFWLFRRGDGSDPSTGDLRWFLHGVF